jgi:hypothetical protein
MIGVVVSRRLATLADLDGRYSVGDLLDLYEVILVDDHNRALMTPKP